MELKIDLLRTKEKSLRLIILGLLALGFLIFKLAWRPKIPSLHDAVILDGIFYGLLFLVGVRLIYLGFGISVTNLFGKAFIIIDKEKISIKAKPYRKEQRVNWKDIKSINCDLSKYYIIKIDGNKQVIDFSTVGHPSLTDIKKIVSTIAMDTGLVLSVI